jgi:hypothetical protein
MQSFVKHLEIDVLFILQELEHIKKPPQSPIMLTQWFPEHAFASDLNF